MAEKTGRRKRSFWKNPWWLIPALVSFVWLILALGDRTPTVRLTRPVPPNPNAYDYYVHAGYQLLEQAEKSSGGHSPNAILPKLHDRFVAFLQEPSRQM